MHDHLRAITRAARDSRSPFGSRLLGPGDQSPRQLRVRIQLLLTALLVGSNLVGAILVAVMSLFLMPGPKPNTESWVALSIAIPVYVGSAVVIGATFGTRTTVRALRWAFEGRRPDDRDREIALRVPLWLTQMQAALWVFATVVFTVLAVVLQPARAVTTGLTVGIAAIVGCGVAYLLTEWAWRPVAARALEGHRAARGYRGAGVGGRMVIFWIIGTATPIIGLAIVAVLVLACPYAATCDDDPIGKVRFAIITLTACVVVLVFGLFITVLNARAVVAPVESVRDALVDVERGDLSREVVVYDATELGLLQAGFNEMVHGLREREKIRDLFGRHVGREVAEAAADATGGVALGGESLVASVLFVDLVGSTNYATEHRPQDVVAMLNRFFDVVVEEVDQRQGLVNKFIGDAVLAIFGAPVEMDDHAGAALGAARAMAARLREEVPEIGAGIGVATGEVVAGNVGHEQRFEYTVIGDAVNSASRLTELAKDVPGLVVATQAAVDMANVEEATHWKPHGRKRLRGRSTETGLAVPVEDAG